MVFLLCITHSQLIWLRVKVNCVHCCGKQISMGIKVETGVNLKCMDG